MFAPSGPATVRLPRSAIAPGFRDSIGRMSQFRLRDVTDSSGVIEPMEGLGAVYSYFTAYRLCDASTAVTPETFDVLRQYPAWDTNDSTPRTNVGGDPDPDWRDKLLKHAHELAEKKQPGFEFAAIDAKLGAIPREHVPEYLANQAPVFFDEKGYSARST